MYLSDKSAFRKIVPVNLEMEILPEGSVFYIKPFDTEELLVGV